MTNQHYDELKEKLLELAHLQATLAVLQWDQEVHMPPKGAQTRANALSLLAGLTHEKFLSLNNNNLLDTLKKDLDNNSLSDSEAAVVREVWHDYKRQKKLPTKLVTEFFQTTSAAIPLWVEARKKSDFQIFLPILKKIIDVKQREAKLVGYKDSPYTALLDEFEPHMTTQEVEVVLNNLKDFLIPFIKKIKQSKTKVDPSILLGRFPIAKQQHLNQEIAQTIGFDFEAGRVDTSTHPFATGFHPHDVRITTRYDEKNLFYSLASVTHEVGHAMYEQGLPVEYFGTPLGQAISLGIHESQSRMWENQVGLSKPFWDYFYPKLQKVFPKPFKTLPLEEFYRAINYVQPSLIRTESDEVTYNLHIILRFEIEKGLIEGTIQAEDLSRIWNAKMKDYFGITVPDDAHGVLQDIHWSHGSFGYFPTYSLGNLYAAQFFATAKKELPDLDTEFAKGEFAKLKNWLQKNIHAHGRYYTASQLVQHVTAEPLHSRYFIDYISAKYSEIYDL